MLVPASRSFIFVLLLSCADAQAQKFSLDNATARAGYTQVSSNTTYSDKLGYGFDLDTSPSSSPFYFSVRLPEGNYNVTVTVGDPHNPSVTTIKAENRRLMVEKIVTARGRTATRTFTVHVRDSLIRPENVPVRLKPREHAYLHWDDKLTLEFGNTHPALRTIDIEPAGSIPTIFLAGNSTVVDQPEEPWAAWGQMIPAFFQPLKVAVANYAESGETLKSFSGERRLAKVWSMARRGDYLFIEFAHNDQKPGPNHLDPFTTYKQEIATWIAEARSRGVIPVLVTSMHRRNFDSSGHIVNTLGDYPAAMRELGKEQGVAVIDLNAMSRLLYEAWGPEGSIHAFVHYPAHTFPGQDKELKDDTHFNSFGAYELAKCVVLGIRSQIPALSKLLKQDLPVFDPAHPDRWETFDLPASRPHATVVTPDSVAGIRDQLRWPAITRQTKPWTRWWWMGSAVDTNDLIANLEQYKTAGLGGLELTPIYGVHGYESQFIDYLSPKWMDLFTFTLQEAKRLGLGIDMTTGTGWPFGGGPLIDSTYACREMFHKTWTVKGGSTCTDTILYQQEPLVRTDGRHTTIDQLVAPVFANKDLQSLALFQVRFPRVLPPIALIAYSSTGRTLDLTSKVDASGHLSWTAPAGGDWTLYGLFLGWHGKMVERAAPGAEGNVIDHFSSTALHKYLSRFDTAFAGRDIAYLRCFFNDSYEVDDARGQSGWTSNFFEAFRTHRGYDLRDHLNALFNNTDRYNPVLCDYRETISDLLLEQFTQPWHDWAHTKGAMIRNQAHGSPANILDLYAASDIPETEGAEILRYKFATSAAHVTGKPLASAETVTWLNEHFLSSYGDVKTALDKYWLGGVNHVFYHGTAYTPVNDPWPGWLFYASVHFTPNDPDWPDFATLNEYVARVQSFLQQGSSDNDILLYYPIYDSWSEPGNALLKHYDRMDPEFTGTGFEECAEFLQNHGYAFDYISDKQLAKLPAETHYKAVILPDCKYISVEALQKLTSLGIPVLAYKSLPKSPPGFDNLQQRTAAFKDLLAKNKFLVNADLDTLLTQVNLTRETLVDDSLGFVRRTYKDGHVYFIVNHGSKTFNGYAPLATAFNNAAIFDPMTGGRGLARQKSGSVYLQLLPGGSCIIETNADSQAPLFPYYRSTADPKPLQGAWRLEFLSGGPALPPATTVNHLGSWTKLDGDAYKSFSGMAKYTLNFTRPAGPAAAWLLDLGKVGRTAEVRINGVKLQTLIGPDFRVTIPASAMHEKNTLEIKVSNGMVNRIEDMDRKGIVWKKFYNYNFPPHERANRGADGLFDASRWAPMDSGILGPVTLTPLQPL